MSLPLDFRNGKGESLPITGKLLLVVNTASACGYTPQYAGLQVLWERYRSRGLQVLAVPCNDFGAQEPDSDGEISAFCASRFQVTFPLAAKAGILDAAGRHPFYAAVDELLGEAGLPRWNFHKYLVSADGTLLGSWPSKVPPDDGEILQAIEAAL